MLEEGSISKIFSYYFSTPKYKDEIFRAIRTFLNKPDLKEGGRLEMSKEEEGMFNEWFLYDFKLKNGKTPLQNFYEENPLGLSQGKLELYKNIQKENIYGLFKIKEIWLGEWIKLEDLQTGKIYKVIEYAATFGLKEGQVFSKRVANVGDHYEMLGSNFGLGPFRIDEEIEKIWRKEKEKLNPKKIRDSMEESREKMEKSKEGDIKDDITFEEAEENLKKVLEKYDLSKFVSTEKIKKWIYNEKGNETHSAITELNLLTGLLFMDRDDYEEALNDILRVFNNFYNFCPKKILKDRSPYEKMEEDEKAGVSPDVETSRKEFPPLGWNSKYHKAVEFLKKSEFKKALEKINEVLEYMLKEQTTDFEIYRIFANKGVCHFFLKEGTLAEFMLKTAIKLNPFYEFAQTQLEKFREAGLDNLKKKEGRVDIKKDIGYRYYKFLEPYEINFTHKPRI